MPDDDSPCVELLGTDCLDWGQRLHLVAEIASRVIIML
jgi:hypothetical protein